MTSIVFDASTLLMSIDREDGWEAVDAIDGDVVISPVNLAEVVTKLTLRGSSAEQIAGMVSPYRLTLPPFTETRAITTGLLAARTRHRGLSLGDRACLALGIELGLPVVTADRAWADLNLDVEIRLIR